MTVSVQDADSQRMAFWTRKRIWYVGYFMEYEAVVKVLNFQRIENAIAFFVVDAPILCDSRSRKVTR